MSAAISVYLTGALARDAAGLHDIEAAVPQKDQVIVVYCHSGAGQRSRPRIWRRMGYTHVYSLDGALTAYEAAGLAVEK